MTVCFQLRGVLGAVWMVVSDEQEKHGQLKVLFHFLCRGAQNYHEDPSLESQAPVHELSLGPLEWEAEMPTAVLLCHVP